jgi:hypothetical protein
VIGDHEVASEAVTTAESCDPSALPPIGERIDVECLDGLFEFPDSSPGSDHIFLRADEIRTDLEVSFRYAGHEVTVTEKYVLLE